MPSFFQAMLSLLSSLGITVPLHEPESDLMYTPHFDSYGCSEPDTNLLVVKVTPAS